MNPVKNPDAVDVQTLKEIAGLWGLDFSRTVDDADISGSPERTERRCVIENGEGRRFLLERIPSRRHDLKLLISRVLEELQDHGGLFILPYLKGPDGQAIQQFGDERWQCSSFLPSASLPRPEYLYHPWRGKKTAAFLVHLRKASAGLSPDLKIPSFSLRGFIQDLIPKLEKHDPGLFQAARPLTDKLEQRFMDMHDDLPSAFCHGDLHALNIIWSEDDIRAVIDWEFMGIKMETYDLATLIGCAGMEHPRGLQGEFVAHSIYHLRKAGVFSDISWSCLYETVLATRMAWLSEWLHKHDRPMAEWEADYIHLLIRYEAELKETWNSI